MTKPSFVNRSNEDDLKWDTTPMEDNLKILKVEFLINRLLDYTQFSNLDVCDQTKFFKYFKWRRPHLEDNLKILKVEYLNNNLLDPTQILN